MRLVGMYLLPVQASDPFDVLLRLRKGWNAAIFFDRSFPSVICGSDQSHIAFKVGQEPAKIRKPAFDVVFRVEYVFDSKTLRRLRHKLHQALGIADRCGPHVESGFHGYYCQGQTWVNSVARRQLRDNPGNWPLRKDVFRSRLLIGIFTWNWIGQQTRRHGDSRGRGLEIQEDLARMLMPLFRRRLKQTPGDGIFPGDASPIRIHPSERIHAVWGTGFRRRTIKGKRLRIVASDTLPVFVVNSFINERLSLCSNPIGLEQIGIPVGQDVETKKSRDDGEERFQI